MDLYTTMQRDNLSAIRNLIVDDTISFSHPMLIDHFQALFKIISKLQSLKGHSVVIETL